MIHTSITLISQTKSKDDLLRKTGDTTNQTTSVTLIITMSTQRRRPKRKTDNIENKCLIITDINFQTRPLKENRSPTQTNLI